RAGSPPGRRAAARRHHHRHRPHGRRGRRLGHRRRLAFPLREIGPSPLCPDPVFGEIPGIMTSSDETGQITIAPVRDENPSVVIGSLVALSLDVAVYAGIAVHTMLCRRRYGKFIDEKALVDLSLPVQFFMLLPGAI